MGLVVDRLSGLAATALAHLTEDLEGQSQPQCLPYQETYSLALVVLPRAWNEGFVFVQFFVATLPFGPFFFYELHSHNLVAHFEVIC